MFFVDNSSDSKSLEQVLLEHHEIVRVGRIPSDPRDVIPERDREVDELALVIHALAADVFVPVILRPRLLSFLQLATHAVAT